MDARPVQFFHAAPDSVDAGPRQPHLTRIGLLGRVEPGHQREVFRHEDSLIPLESRIHYRGSPVGEKTDCAVSSFHS
jgi:hypothetical protein